MPAKFLLSLSRTSKERRSKGIKCWSWKRKKSRAWWILSNKCKIVLNKHKLASIKCRLKLLNWLDDHVKTVSKLLRTFHLSGVFITELISDIQLLQIYKQCPKTNLFKLLDSSLRKTAITTIILVLFKLLCRMGAILQFFWAKPRLQTTSKKLKSLPRLKRLKEML